MTDLQNIYTSAKEFNVTKLYCVLDSYCKKPNPDMLTLKFQVLLKNWQNSILNSEDFCNAVFMVLNDITFTHPIDLEKAIREGHKAPLDVSQPKSPH